MTTDRWITAGLALAAVVIATVQNEIGLASLARHLKGSIETLGNTANTRFDSLEKLMDARFEAAHQSLLRVERVMDARIKHLEED